MSGGRLVVLDRQGRAVKQFELPEGLATLGRDAECDIRVMQTAVDLHHASIVWLDNQALVQSVGDNATFLNGQKVSKAVLSHNDVITLGDRSLRWEYNDPTAKRGVSRIVGQQSASRGRGKMRRRTVAPEPSLRERAQHLASEINRRATMAGTGGKQIAIVQPQRRDTSDQMVKTSPRPITTNTRPRNTNIQLDTSINESEADRSKRKSAKASPKSSTPTPQNTTKATLWIESRKTSPRKSLKANTSVKVNPENSVNIPEKRVQGGNIPGNKVEIQRTSPRKSMRVQTPAQIRVANARKMFSSAKKSTPLRMAVLRKAQSAHKVKVTKIQAPSKIDHTKQAALLLMTGHTPKSKISPTTKGPSYVVKKPSPVRKTPASGRKSTGRRSKENNTPSSIGITPKRASTYDSSVKKNNRNSGSKSVSILEITDSEAQNSTQKSLRRSGQRSPLKSPVLPTPKKSALKDPKRNTRKTESIKFDLSNLENQETSDVFMVTDTTKQTYDGDSASDTEMTLHYSDVTSSPSPRRPINSRSSRILEKTLGTTLTLSPPLGSLVTERTKIPDSPGSRKSSRGSVILEKALSATNDYSESSYSRRTSKTVSETNQSEGSLASAFKTHTLSPRSTRNDIESYSIVDLVSVDSNDTGRSGSLYNSVGSSNNSEYETPQNSVGRKTRSTIDNNFLGSSTPYVGKVTRSSNRGFSQSYRSSIRSQSSPNVSQLTNKTLQSNKSAMSTRRSKSLTTPENSQKYISVNSTRISRRSRSRSRINDSDLLALDGEESDSSPKTSRRVSKASQNLTTTLTESNSPVQNEGTITPEDRYSPRDVGTPVLSIQSLLNSSQSSLTSQTSNKNRRKYNRKTIGVLSENRKRQSDVRSRSLNISAKKTILRLSKDSSDDEVALQPDNDDVVTPTSAVKLVPEAVKNKHSTAKKNQSKRSIIDDLNQSDIVKQLFNSPVKRKLSQSMTEFSRKRLFEEDDEVVTAKRPTRNTIALTGRTLDDSILDHTEAYTPERFVSPINTPSNSPNLSGIKRLFRKNTPDNDLNDVRGVKELLRTPGARRSIRNDLTNISGVKSVFARSPANRLSDVRVKNIFVKSPNNDLRQVSGVKSLLREQNSPKNDLTDVRGVKKMFTQNSPVNDLRNVSGVKRLQRKSPRNDLTDVRGVRKLFKQGRPRSTLNVSGVEELFNTSYQSSRDTDRIFDQLLGKPTIRAVYSNTFSTRLKSKNKAKQTKSLHSSIDVNTNNVEEWLQNELQKRLNKDKRKSSASNSLARELSRIATNTLEGNTPIRHSRVRDSTLIKTITGEEERKKSASEIYSARKLPIKKRSLVEKSLEKSNVGDKSRLPIKKRLIIHSTPVKGWNSLLMNASELGRVSPIASAENTREVKGNTSARNTKTQHETYSKTVDSLAQKTRRIISVPEEPVVPSKPSPRKTRTAVKNGSKATTSRQRQTAKNSSKNAKNSPVVSPKSIETKSSEKRTRRQQIAKIQTPKSIKTKKGTIVVPKPSPVIKPSVSKEDTSKTRATRARKTVLNESLKESKRTTRNNKANVNITKSPGIKAPEPESRKGYRKTIVAQIKEMETKGRARVVIEENANCDSEVIKQTRRTKVNSPVKNPVNQATRPRTRKGKTESLTEDKPVAIRRGRKRQAIEVADTTQPNNKRQLRKVEDTKESSENVVPKGNKSKQAQVEIKKRYRRNKEITESVNTSKVGKTRGNKKLQKVISDDSNTEIEVKTRSRRNKDPIVNKSEVHINQNATKTTSRLQKTVSLEIETGSAKGRKRKTVIEDINPPEIKRGRNKAVEVIENVRKTRQKRINKDDSNPGNKSDATSEKSVGVARKGRGGKVAAVATVSEQETNKRKRNATSTAQDTIKEPLKKTRKTAQAPVVKTRAQRAKETQASTAPASRTRKR